MNFECPRAAARLASLVGHLAQIGPQKQEIAQQTTLANVRKTQEPSKRGKEGILSSLSSLGGGSSGSVLGLKRFRGDAVAVKLFHSAETCSREAHALKVCAHENVIGLYTKNDQSIAMELAESNALLYVQNVVSCGVTADRTTHKLVEEFLQGLKAVHEAGFAHNAVNLENILLCKGKIKLCDFAHSVWVGTNECVRMDEITCGCGYAAPELLEMQQHVDPKKCDIYAAGVCIYAMITGEHLTGRSLTKSRCGGLLEPLRLLVSQMLGRDPSNRPSAEHCLHMFRNGCISYGVDWQEASWYEGQSLPIPPMRDQLKCNWRDPNLVEREANLIT